MQRMNERTMRKLGVSRRELFETIERDALIALPADDWEFAEWRRARVNLDYHIEAHDFLYSVPHALLRAEVDVRITARTVEIFHRGQRVGAHQRRYLGRKHGTDPDHMPSSHRRYAEWTPDRFRRWAGKIGPNTEGLISAVLESRPHPEQGFRTCLGILRAYRGLDPARLEAVSARAVELGVLNCKGVASLLSRKFDSSGADSSPSRSSTTPTCAVPATTTDRKSHARSSDPRPIERAWPSRPGQRLQGPGAQRRGARPRSRRMARPAARIRAYATPAEAVRNTRQGRASASSRQCRGRQLSKSPRARPRAVPQARRLRLDRRAPQFAHHRGERPGQELARLRPRPQGVPGKPLRPLYPHAQALRRSRHRPRRRPLRQAPALARARQAAHPRRLGPGGAHPRTGARPARNRRGSLRQGLDHHHEPGSRGPLA